MESRNTAENQSLTPPQATPTVAVSVSAVLPSHQDLVREYVKIESEELRSKGKEFIHELSDPLRRSELQLIDTIIHYLHNPEAFATKDEPLMSYSDRMMDANLAKEDRDILAGAMFFVCNEIYSTYYVRSATNSLVYSRLKETLAPFDPASEKVATAAFVNYFLKHIAGLEGQKSLKGVYSAAQIVDAIPNEIMAEIKQKRTPILPVVTRSVNNPSPLNFLTFGLWGSSQAKPTSTAAEVDHKIEQESAINLSK